STAPRRRERSTSAGISPGTGGTGTCGELGAEACGEFENALPGVFTGGRVVGEGAVEEAVRGTLIGVGFDVDTGGADLFGELGELLGGGAVDAGEQHQQRGGHPGDPGADAVQGLATV